MLNSLDFLYFIQNHLRSPFLDKLFVFITYLGGPVNIFIIIGIIYFFLKNRREEGTAILLSLVLSAIIAVLILKKIINEPRPCDVDTSVILLVKRPYGQSLPSGHAAVTAAGATIFFIYKNKFRWLALLFTIVMCYTRMYLFVHYPLDVVTGLIVGVLSAFLAMYLLKYLPRRLVVARKK